MKSGECGKIKAVAAHGATVKEPPPAAGEMIIAPEIRSQDLRYRKMSIKESLLREEMRRSAAEMQRCKQKNSKCRRHPRIVIVCSFRSERTLRCELCTTPARSLTDWDLVGLAWTGAAAAAADCATCDISMARRCSSRNGWRGEDKAQVHAN